MQKMAVVVQFLGSFEYLKIADHVSDNECEEYAPLTAITTFLPLVDSQKRAGRASRAPITVVAMFGFLSF